MRILIVEPAGNLWGSERVLLDFLHAAASANSFVMGVCCPPATPILSELAHLPVEVLPAFPVNLHRQNKARWLRAAFKLMRTAARFRPDLIYVNQAGATRIALVAGRILKLPVVTHVRLAEDVRYVQALRAPVHTLPKIICISRHIRDMFTADSAVTDQQLTTLYDPYRARGEWNGLATTSPASTCRAFACVGRLAAIKGQDILLRAIAALQAEGINIDVTFVGAAAPDDAFGDELEEMSHELKVTDRVHWAGFQNDVLSFITDSEALICPSHEEPLGRVIFEAWDMGIVPIVWAGSGGAAETIAACDGGLLYEEQNADSLARALRAAMALNQSERNAMIGRGRDWLREQCDPQNYANEMFEIWRHAVDKS